MQERVRVRESEIYYRLFSFATSPRESDWSPNEVKRKMIDLWKLIGQTDFGPSPRRVRTESERVRNPRFLYRKNCALSKLFAVVPSRCVLLVFLSAINTENQISSEFLTCQSLTG